MSTRQVLVAHDNGLKMAAVQRRKADTMLPPLSVGRGKPVPVKGGAEAPRGLLRRPRMPDPIQLPPEPPEPPDSPEPSKSVVSDISHINSYAGLYRYSPEPSVHPSVVSPPPPSELQSHHNYPPHHHLQQRQPRPTGYVMKGDTKYVLDPLYRDKTNVGTYVEGRALVKPYRTRGPGALPTKPPKQFPQLAFYPFPLGDEYDLDRYYEPPAFTLQDFLIKVSQAQRLPLEKVKQVMFSKHNYQKIQRILATELIPKQTDFSVTQLRPSSDMPHVTPRVPQRQLLLEMAALVKEQMSESMNTKMKAVIRPLPKYSPSHHIGASVPHTEILLYEASTADQQDSKARGEKEAPGKDSIFRSWCGRYFHGALRSDSPFALADENVISPAELAVLDSLMSGGTALSLKANFIASLPDIEALSHTISYLNLSFNDFRMVPIEVLDLSHLTVLKLRNNPLQEVPHDLHRLRQLRVLVLSFCLISELPPSIFKLTQLEHLDIAYNRVQTLPNDIKNLKMLRELNVEGNQLKGMPMGALRLRNLVRLKVSNNFMHPMFWSENSQCTPQRLLDIAALNFTSAGLRARYQHVPDYVKRILDNPGTCECCAGPLYGPGLSVIRHVSKIFGVKNLPFLFSCCSPYCKEGFMASTDTLTELLYGCEVEEHMGDE